MKCILTFTTIILLTSTYVFANIYVNEYPKKDGSHVTSHYRAQLDNKYDL